jgi:ParB family transcriptional regulator, chromosome partitioning protein
MSKMDQLRRSSAGNVAESMGAGLEAQYENFVRRPIPAYLQGVARSKDVAQIQLDRIAPDPEQPREEFDEESLGRLAESLKTRGQLQPIRVRWDQGRGLYAIICGERRWRAARIAGIESVSCVIVEGTLSSADLLAIQLVENALREDLKPIEQAKAYRQLMDQKGWSTRQVARELSIAQPQVVRTLALMGLPEPVQQQVEQGTLAPATAYEIAKLDSDADQRALAERVVTEKMTRQETAEAVKTRRISSPIHGVSIPTRPATAEFQVSAAVVVSVKYKKADRLTIVQALKLALKQATAVEKRTGNEHAA